METAWRITPPVFCAVSGRRTPFGEAVFLNNGYRNFWKLAAIATARLASACYFPDPFMGVALSIYCVVIGLSGSALVFGPEIDDWQHPHTLHLAEGVKSVNLAETIHRIEAERPGWLGVGLEDLDKKDRATILFMSARKPGSESYSRLVSFNPYTGQVLVDRMRYEGAMGWVTNLHYYLLAGETGLLVSGGMAAGLLLLCVSGLVLWWPGVRRWMSALMLRRRVRWQRFNWDLHAVIGFWCCAVLGVVALTGVYFAFPNPVCDFIVLLTGGGRTETQQTKRVPSTGAKLLTIDEAVAAARRALPADAPPAYFYLPDAGAKKVTPYSQLATVSIDSYSGEILSFTDTRKAILGERIIQYFFAIHFGWFGGVVVKALWVVLGMVLAVSGLGTENYVHF